MAECPNRKKNEETCPCTYTECVRHGVCCECMRNHLASKGLPACAKPKKS